MTRPLSNRFLSMYGKQAGAGTLPELEAIPMPFKYELYCEGERPRYVHFITSGASSLIALLSEGAEVEVAMTGYEGFSEAIYLLGPELAPRTCFMQVGGSGLRMPFVQFERLFESDAILRKLVLRLIQFQHLSISQLVACNGQHDVESRLARWLLMVHDRVGEPELPLTQEFLAQMLGTRRSSVTIAASNLQRAGMIEYRRGSVRILDHERLTETACECYQVIHQLLENLYN